MMLIKHKLLKCFCLGFIYSILTIPVVSQNKEIIEIEGRVIGRSLKDLVELQGFPRQQNFFVIVEKSNDGENFPKFIKIRNTYNSRNEKLTEKFFKGKKSLIFRVQRESSCDEMIDNWNNKKEILLFDNYDGLSRYSAIQCFLLQRKTLK